MSVVEYRLDRVAKWHGFEGYVAEARDYVAHYAGEPPAGAVRGVMRHLAEIDQVLALILGTGADLASLLDEPGGVGTRVSAVGWLPEPGALPRAETRPTDSGGITGTVAQP